MPGSERAGRRSMSVMQHRYADGDRTVLGDSVTQTVVPAAVEDQRRLPADAGPEERADDDHVRSDHVEARSDRALEPGMRSGEERRTGPAAFLIRDPVELALAVAREKPGEIHLRLAEHIHREVR